MHKVTLNITVDWEGEDLSGLHDFNVLRKKWAAEIPITHFICPAYFTENIKGAADKIKATVLPHDEIALHVHCYRSLVEYAGVEFRTEPNYYRTNKGILPEGIRNLLQKKWKEKLTYEVSGRGVPLSAYSEDEIEKIITASCKLLADNLGVETVSGIRAGGWIADDKVFRVLKKLGFKYDSSAVPPSILSNGFSEKYEGDYTDNYDDSNGVFTEYIIKLWGGKLASENFLQNSFFVKSLSGKPIVSQQQAFSINGITEMPNNLSMTDFASIPETLMPEFERAYALAKGGFESSVLNTGCHIEGIDFPKQILHQFISQIKKHDTQFVKFETVGESARR